MYDDRFSRSSRHDLSALSFLVVEDNPNMQKLLGVMLRAIGVTDVRQAYSGEEALALLQDSDIDIVITDWEMAPMNGLELTLALRDREKSQNPYLPIIMVTGKTDREHVFAARDAGINHLLTKPVSVKALSDRITALIERPAPFVTTGTYFGPNRRHHKVRLPEGIPDRRRSGSDAWDSEEFSRKAPSKSS